MDTNPINNQYNFRKYCVKLICRPCRITQHRTYLGQAIQFKYPICPKCNLQYREAFFVSKSFKFKILISSLHFINENKFIFSTGTNTLNIYALSCLSDSVF